MVSQVLSLRGSDPKHLTNTKQQGFQELRGCSWGRVLPPAPLASGFAPKLSFFGPLVILKRSPRAVAVRPQSLVCSCCVFR